MKRLALLACLLCAPAEAQDGFAPLQLQNSPSPGLPRVWAPGCCSGGVGVGGESGGFGLGLPGIPHWPDEYRGLYDYGYSRGGYGGGYGGYGRGFGRGFGHGHGHGYGRGGGRR
jgi:hypothetical protein